MGPGWVKWKNMNYLFVLFQVSILESITIDWDSNSNILLFNSILLPRRRRRVRFTDKKIH